jgi:hypothetical protein
LQKNRSSSPIEVKVVSDLDRPILKLKQNAPDSINASIASLSTLLLTVMDITQVPLAFPIRLTQHGFTIQHPSNLGLFFPLYLAPATKNDPFKVKADAQHRIRFELAVILLDFNIKNYTRLFHGKSSALLDIQGLSKLTECMSIGHINVTGTTYAPNEYDVAKLNLGMVFEIIQALEAQRVPSWAQEK